MLNIEIKNQKQRALFQRGGLLIHAIGILLGIVLYGGAVWADLEAFLFDASLSANASLNTLSCPMLITTNDTGIITARINNKTDQPVERMARAHITEGLVTLMREINSKITIEANSTGVFEWEIYPEDAVYSSRLILFRTFIFPDYPIPSSGSTCGVLLIQTELFSGPQVLWLVIGLTTILVVCGRLLWHLGTHPINQKRLQNVTSAMNWLDGFVFAGILFSLLGFWGISGILLVVSLLMIGVLFGRYAPAED